MPEATRTDGPTPSNDARTGERIAIDHSRLRHHGSTGFWDGLAARYARQPISDEAAYQKKLAITRQYLHAGAEVLEFGCGTGSTALLHAPFVSHILATDASAKMIAIARQKAESAGVRNVTFQQAAIEGIAAAPATFDVVMALSVLHLLRDRRAAMAQAYAMLKPGGVFVTSTACLLDFFPLFRFAAPLGRWVGLVPYVSCFSGKTLRDELRATGFEIIEDWQPERKAALFLILRKPS